MREEKLRKQAKKRQQKENALQAKQASSQLHTKLTVRAKKVLKIIQAPKQNDHIGGIDLGVVEDEDPPAPLNTCRRQIHLPKRYQPTI